MHFKNLLSSTLSLSELRPSIISYILCVRVCLNLRLDLVLYIILEFN